MEDSFFLYKKLNKKLNLTNEIIKINYGKESPYKNSTLNITSILNKKNLYLWFHKNTNHTRFLPLDLLLFRTLSVNYNNIICIFKEDVDKILIIKENQLIASFLKKNINESNIILIKNEYGIKDIKIFKDNELKNFCEKGYKYLTYNDLFNILNIEINIKRIGTTLIRWIAFPFLLSSIILVLIIGIYSFYRESENKKLLENYKANKSINLEMQKSLHFVHRYV